MDLTAVENLGYEWIPRLVGALLVLWIGFWLVRIVSHALTRMLEQRGIETTLASFLASTTNVGLKILVVITAATTVGIETTSFIALLGAAGLAIGLALQGSLSNFAGGALIVFFKPFKVGDVIDAQGVIGKVSEIQIFNTVLHTPDNRKVIVPNGALSNGIVTNISAESTRRVDFVFGISYDDDIDNARRLIQEVIRADVRMLDDPAPQVVVAELADSSVNFTVRVWCESADYWDVFFDTTEKIKKVFDGAGVSIPYPQQDVHVHRDAG